MKLPQPVLSLLLLLSLVSCTAQTKNKQLTEKRIKAEQGLTLHPHDQQLWQDLYTIMNDHYIQFTAEERARVRTVLEQRCSWPTGTLYTAGEPGIKIIIKGHVLNAKGKPVANALLHIFQTDSHGYYTPLDSITKKMGEPDARLYGFLKTDSNGSFEIRTVRPASYPRQYEGRTIPQHIHVNVTAQGYTGRYMQVVFDDDPAMNSYWRDWAMKNGFPMISLDHSVERTAILEIVLTEQH